MVCANETNRGMVMSEITVESETMFTDKSVALSNFAENIVVMAAVGAQAAITTET